MAKANKKNTESNVKSTLNLSDLSVEKRIEIANERFNELSLKINADLGLALDIQLAATQKGIFPRAVWVDVTAQKKQQTIPVPENEEANKKEE